MLSHKFLAHRLLYTDFDGGTHNVKIFIYIHIQMLSIWKCVLLLLHQHHVAGLVFTYYITDRANYPIVQMGGGAIKGPLPQDFRPLVLLHLMQSKPLIHTLKYSQIMCCNCSEVEFINLFRTKNSR
jgi:hypothetical protein